MTSLENKEGEVLETLILNKNSLAKLYLGLKQQYVRYLYLPIALNNMSLIKDIQEDICSQLKKGDVTLNLLAQEDLDTSDKFRIQDYDTVIFLLNTHDSKVLDKCTSAKEFLRIFYMIEYLGLDKQEFIRTIMERKWDSLRDEDHSFEILDLKYYGLKNVKDSKENQGKIRSLRAIHTKINNTLIAVSSIIDGEYHSIIGIFSSREKAYEYIVVNRLVCKNTYDVNGSLFHGLSSIIDDNFKLIDVFHLDRSKPIYLIQNQGYLIRKSEVDSPKEYLVQTIKEWEANIVSKDEKWLKKCTLTIDHK